MTKTAVIYARVSSAQQASEELPIQSQLERARQRAGELGTTVLKEFVDEGRSGRTVERRPQFQAAIAFCEANPVDHFIAWDTSRFARDHVDAGFYKRALEKVGTKLVFVVSAIPEGDDAWFFHGIYSLIDEKYSRNVSRDTIRSMLKNARDGNFNGGRVPFGYQVVTEGKRRRLELHDTEASVVREIFALCNSGNGAWEICESLNKRGLTRRGKLWTKSVVLYTLQSETYAGWTVFGKTSADGTLRAEAEQIRTQSRPAIVDQDVWQTAQDSIAARAPKVGVGSPKSTWLFTGILKCGKCGGGLMIETATGRSKRYAYYQCSTFLKKAGCRSRRIPAASFDRWLSGEITRTIVTPARVREVAAEMEVVAREWIQSRKKLRLHLIEELRGAERRYQNLMDALEVMGRSAATMDTVGVRMTELKARIRDLETTLQDTEEIHEVDHVFDLEDIEAIIRSSMAGGKDDAASARAFYSDLIEKIVVDAAGVDITYRAERLIPADAVHNKEGWLPVPSLLRTVRVNHRRLALAA